MKRASLVILAVLAGGVAVQCQEPIQRSSVTPFVLGYVGVSTTDLAQTCVGLARGLREGNPLLPGNCAGQVAIAAVATGGTSWLLLRLAQTHPKIARVMAVAGIGIESFVVVSNARLLHRVTR